MTQLEWVAATCGFLSVACYIYRSFWAWPTGLVQVLLYVGVFLQSKLYADMVLHVVYVGLQCYGWWAWHHAVIQCKTNSPDSRVSSPISPQVRVRSLTVRELLLVLGCVVLMTVCVALALMRWTDARLPIPDSLVAATSIAAQLLLARRFLENWLFWIVVDIVGVGLFASRGLYPTAALYTLFGAMAVVGWLQWRRASHTEGSQSLAAL